MIVKRRDRLVDITSYLLMNPNHSVNLHFFMRRYRCSKSSLSNDIAIIKHNFQALGRGLIKTSVGADGGIIYIPTISQSRIRTYLGKLVQQLNQKDRRLPGGYVYIADLLSQPGILKRMGRIIANAYLRRRVDVVLSMSNKAAVAPFVANYLSVPFVIAQRHSQISDGAVMSVNCFSADNQRVKQLVLSRRSLPIHSHVLIVGDFLKGGSTVNGMLSLVKAFNCSLAGVTIFVDESGHRTEPFKVPYRSLIRFASPNHDLKAVLGNLKDK